MKKAFLSVGAVCLILLLAISFSSCSVTVGPGPGPGVLYTMSVTNNSGVPLRLEIHDDMIFDFIIRQSNVSSWMGATGSVLGESGYYFRIRNLNTGQYVQFTGGNTYWYITGSQSFTVSGGWVTAAR